MELKYSRPQKKVMFRLRRTMVYTLGNRLNDVQTTRVNIRLSLKTITKQHVRKE